MSIYDYEARFGAADKTTKEMKSAIEEWFALYYLAEATSGKLFPRYSATITVTVQLYDAQGNRILIRDMDLSY